MEVAYHSTEAIDGLNKPTTVTELRSFLGLRNVFRRFVPNSAIIANPLTKNLRKDEPSTFDRLDRDVKKVFENFMATADGSPSTGIIQLNGRYTIHSDACDKQIECLLLQEQAYGTTEPIAYWLRMLNPAEGTYDTTHKEYLAVLWATLLLRRYL